MPPDIVALDFDGVICDGLVEYFQTAWKAYCRIWNPTPQTPPQGLAQRFYPLRPVVETGWEMPVLLRSLLLGSTDQEILDDWQTIAHQRLEVEALSSRVFAEAVDGVRDEWIQSDVDDWLSQHSFYSGVIERLQQLLAENVELFVISTKEGRFIQHLLRQHQVEMPANRIYGKEVRQPKHETLRQLTTKFMTDYGRSPNLYFVEDRLKTLYSIDAQPDLDHVSLYLADWGYNTAGDRAAAKQHPRIRLVSLKTFAQDDGFWNEGSR